MATRLDHDRKMLRIWWRGMTGFAAALAVTSCISAILCKSNLAIKCTNAVVWSLGPPSWFLFERGYLIRKYGRSIDLQTWRENADLATKFWAGIGLLLAFLYT